MAVGALQPLPEGRHTFKNILSGTQQTRINIKQVSKHKGEPALIYTDPEVNQLSDLLQLALIGKFIGKRPSMEFLRKGFKTIGFIGDYQLGLIDEQHILIRFALAEDYHRCWLHGIWNFKSYQMRVLKWTPTFHVEEEPAFASVWVALERLPLFMFSKEPMFSIGSFIGTPLKIDTATENLTRPSVARICVEVDLLKPLPRRFWIGQGDTGYWQNITYEKIPSYCISCKRFGHKNGDCSHPGKQDSLPHSVPELAWKAKRETHKKEAPAATTKVSISEDKSSPQIQQQNDTEHTAKQVVSVMVDSIMVSEQLVGHDSVMEKNLSDTIEVTGSRQPVEVTQNTIAVKCPANVCEIAKQMDTDEIGPETEIVNTPSVEDITKDSSNDIMDAEAHRKIDRDASASVEQLPTTAQTDDEALYPQNGAEENLAVPNINKERPMNTNDISVMAQAEMTNAEILVRDSNQEAEPYTDAATKGGNTSNREEDQTDQAAESHPNHSPTVDDETEKENPTTEVRSTSEPKQTTIALNPNAIEFHLPNVIEKESSPTNAAISEKPRMEDQTSSPTLVVDFSHHNLVNLTGDIITQEQIDAITEEIHKVVYHESYDTQYEHEIEVEEEEWLEEDEEEYWENEDIMDKFFHRRRGRSPSSRRKTSFVPHTMRRRSSKSLD